METNDMSCLFPSPFLLYMEVSLVTEYCSYCLEKGEHVPLVQDEVEGTSWNNTISRSKMKCPKCGATKSKPWIHRRT